MRGARWRRISGLVVALAAIALLVWLALRSDREEPPRELEALAITPAVASAAESASPSSGARTERISAEVPSAPEREESNALLIRVVDAEERPSPDVAVHVRQAPRGLVLLSGSTLGNGEIVFEAAREKLLAAAAETLLEVVVRGIIPEPDSVPLDPTRCFEDGVLLRLPPLAELTLRVTRIDGTELSQGAAEVLPQALAGGVAPRYLGECEHALRAEIVGGTASFRHIQAGVPLWIIAQDGAWDLFVRAEHAGLIAGTRNEVELRFAYDREIWRGRAIDGATAAPLAHAMLTQTSILVKQRTSASQTRNIRADEHGVFYCDPGSTQDAAELWLELADPQHGRQMRAVPLALGSGVHDLGDWVLRLDPPRVAGTVVDEKGELVPRAQVQAVAVFDGMKDATRLRFEHVAATLYADEAGRFAWIAPPISDDPMTAAAVRFSLQASSGDARSAPYVARNGAADIVLRVQKTGGFSGRVLLDPRAPLHLYAFEHHSSDDHGPHAWTTFFAGNPERLQVLGLHAGRYDFRVRLAGTEEGAVLVEAIDVESGRITAEPRLEPLDLRQAFALFDFEIEHSPDCIPYDLKLVLVRTPPASELRIRGAMVSQTRAAMLAPPGVYDASFEAPGFRSVVLRGLTEGCRVQLEAAYALRLRFDAALATSKAAAALELVLRGAGGEEIVRPIGVAANELFIALSKPGRYELLWRERLPASEGGALRLLGAGTPAFVEVRAAAPDQATHISPPAR